MTPRLPTSSIRRADVLLASLLAAWMTWPMVAAARQVAAHSRTFPGPPLFPATVFVALVLAWYAGCYGVLRGRRSGFIVMAVLASLFLLGSLTALAMRPPSQVPWFLVQTTFEILTIVYALVRLSTMRRTPV